MKEDEIRSVTRKKIESLEHWLRRLINTQFSAEYGSNYFDIKDSNGNYIINSQIRNRASNLKSQEPKRCPRLIDALFLDDLMNIICNQNHWKRSFRVPLHHAFPNGGETARIFIKRVIAVRNPLSHANHISYREAEQAICYSNDIIESIKIWHQNNNQMSDYNAPFFIRIYDSLGNEQHFTKPTGGGSLPGSTDRKLYVGETIVINAEVDPSFDPEQYVVNWECAGETITGNQLNLLLENKHVGKYLDIRLILRSNKDWHRYQHNSSDGYCSIQYEVLPIEN